MRGPPTDPGQIALTRMPAEPSSIAHVLVSPTTAHFAAAYGDRSGYPKMPAVDEMLTIEPGRSRSNRHGQPCAAKHRAEVDLHAVIERGRIHLVDRRGRAGDPHVVDQHIETTEADANGGEQVVDRCRVGNIGNEIGLGRRVCIDHHHVGAAGGQPGGDRCADARATAGDQRSQACKIPHGSSIVVSARVS